MAYYNPYMYNPYEQQFQGQTGTGFQPVQTQPVQQPQQTQQPVMVPMYWVQGDVVALSYRLMPNEKVFFMDIEKPLIYMREADATGKPLPMVTKQLIDYHPEQPKEDKPQKIDTSEFVKYSEIQQMIEDEVARRMEQISFKPTSTSRKKSED